MKYLMKLESFTESKTYIKAYEKLNTIKYSNLDNIIDKIKSKLNDNLEKEFSKYLTPATINLINKKVKVFLLESNYGVRISIDFESHPYRTIANISTVFNENGRWRRGSYTKFFKESQLSVEEFVLEYVEKLKVNCERRKERKFKKDIKTYNL